MGPARRIAAPVAAVALALTVLAGCTDEESPRGAAGSADPSGASETAVEADAAERPAPPAPPRPRTAKQALAQILAAEQAIEDPATGPAALRRAGRAQQLAYRELGRRPQWDRTVLRGLPGPLRSVVRDNVASRREFRSMHTTLADTLPAWRIVPPAPVDDLLRFYRRGEAAYGIGWEYLAAINLVETGLGRIRGTSVAGAQGPMQFMPATWARWGRGDINDPADAIMAAARYLAHNGGARPGGMANALFRYNNSTAYVRGVTHIARVLERRPRAFLGYYHWEIYYLTSAGDVLLPVGYHRDRPVPVRRWLATHPQA